MTSWSAVGPQQWPFVVREDLLGVLQVLLAGGVTRGVVIDGPAGTGKTRLADEFNHSLLDWAGLTSKEIAGRLYLSPRTVESHLQRVYTKLGVAGRDDLAGVLG